MAGLGSKRVLILGAGGQDGYYLGKLLREHGHEVVAGVRAETSDSSRRLLQLGLRTALCDVLDSEAVIRLLAEESPDWVFNLAGKSSVAASWTDVGETTRVNALGALNVLEAIRVSGLGAQGTRYFQASSSEMFGDTHGELATESHLLEPRSPYGVSKAFAHHMTRVYRESYGIHASSGVLFNHESPLRDRRFVSKKIVRAVAEVAVHGSTCLRLGNMQARRDWSFAGDVTRAMLLILQSDIPDDFVIASGTLNSVEDFVKLAFKVVGVDDWHRFVEVDERLLRPNDISALAGDASHARSELRWAPTVDFPGLIDLMVAHECSEVARQT